MNLLASSLNSCGRESKLTALYFFIKDQLKYSTRKRISDKADTLLRILTAKQKSGEKNLCCLAV